ncbi:MAG: response regulator [Gammaproteobacteria bacterium]|nr:response regulator [Gammaproteobacteria bacterium]
MTVNHASILIVDDEELNHSLIRRILDFKYDIQACVTGEEAIELIKKQSYDLILLDIALPGISGLEILNYIKKSPELSHTQVIMITANDDRETVMSCVDSGASDYLIKPFVIPIVKSRITRALNKKSNLSNSSVSDANVLIIDDQELNRDVLAHRLRKSGYKVTCASNASEGMKLLSEIKYDLILLDIMLPEISGIEILKKMRNDDIYKDTPIIMVTAVDDMQSVNECMQAGADDYILKPVNTSLLKLRIASCLQMMITN